MRKKFGVQNLKKFGSFHDSVISSSSLYRSNFIGCLRRDKVISVASVYNSVSSRLATLFGTKLGLPSFDFSCLYYSCGPAPFQCWPNVTMRCAYGPAFAALSHVHERPMIRSLIVLDTNTRLQFCQKKSNK